MYVEIYEVTTDTTLATIFCDVEHICETAEHVARWASNNGHSIDDLGWEEE